MSPEPGAGPSLWVGRSGISPTEVKLSGAPAIVNKIVNNVANKPETCLFHDELPAGTVREAGMSFVPRRVVTATDSHGRSYFLLDGPAGNVSEQPGRGLTFHELWITDGPLASNEGTADAAAVPVEHHPPLGGSRIRIVEFLPDHQHVSGEAAADFAAIGADDRVIGDADDGRHRNDTVDYNIILSGEIYACTDAGELLLRPGDVLIQRGTKHTWHNRGDVPCIFASIMISAEPLRVQSA